MFSQPVESGFVVTSPMGARSGGYHWGTDYGRAGGSGGYPVYAIADGTVTRSGPASGFGRWITINHNGLEGVYGHIIPEVSAGQRVTRGQRIARIDPNSNTNGGVAPHLHLEVHRGGWQQPGPNRLNPQTVLRGAPFPDNSQETPGVLYGIDVSEHQDNFNLCDAVNNAGLDFVILRTNDGTYKDRLFHSHLADVERSDALIAVYWYLRAPSEGTTIAQQADTVAEQLRGRTDLGVWIDVESVSNTGVKLLTGDDVHSAKRELEKRGLYVPGVYTGRWYWEHMPGGEPSMAGLGHLWVSDYGQVDRSGTPAAVYNASGGNAHRGWSYPLGDRKPDLLQIGSRGVINGYHPVDVNVYRGNRAELEKIFSGKGTTNGKETEAVEEIRRILKTPHVSLVNRDKHFDTSTLLSLLDRAAWENRELLKVICDKLNIDWAQAIADAIEEDNREN